VWTRLPAAGVAPEVKYSPPLVYERPRGARFQDVPLRVAVTEGALVGVLSVPEDRALWPKGLAPAVVVLSDRGDQDRFGFGEGTDRGTWELGDALAEHGFAVVRVDDRGVADSASTIEGAERTLGLAVGDATALVEAVARQPAVDPQRVYLLGFGAGGLVALHAAPRASVAGVLLVGTPFRGVAMYLAGEEEKRGKLDRPEAERRARLLVAALGDDPAASAAVDRERLRALRRERAFLLDLSQVDLARVLSEVKVPVGVFQGLKDFEVSWREDTEPLVEAARRAVGKDRVKLHAYDHTDHWMKAEAKTSSYERYADRARRLEPRFVADVLAWLGAQAKSGR
jgi:pimeloyl-ACP methyl ester carboxylesterase